MNKNIFTEKYRPKELNEIKSQTNILNILNELIKTKNIKNNFLFYGLPGLGKTSCIINFAKKYYGNNYKNMYLELNASDDRGINIVRNIITDFINNKSFFNNKNKMIILDEADSMTQEAQKLLIQLMEKNKNIIFCFICNYINKINMAIKSRCLCFHFQKISLIDMKNVLLNITKNENINIKNENIFNDIYKFGNGDLRKSINIFENLIENNEINKNIDLYKIFNYPNIENIKKIIDILINDDFKLNESYTLINNIIKNNNILLNNLINEISLYITKNNIIKDTKKLLYILKKLGDIEYYITTDYSKKIQLYSLISVFKIKI